MKLSKKIPVVTIDGPGGSGKGTVSQLLAARLGWHYLDSGALYRVLGLTAQRRGLGLDDEPALCRLAETLKFTFVPQNDGRPAQVTVDGEDVSTELRTETMASLPQGRGPARGAYRTPAKTAEFPPESRSGDRWPRYGNHRVSGRAS